MLKVEQNLTTIIMNQYSKQITTIWNYNQYSTYKYRYLQYVCTYIDIHTQYVANSVHKRSKFVNRHALNRSCMILPQLSQHNPVSPINKDQPVKTVWMLRKLLPAFTSYNFIHT